MMHATITPEKEQKLYRAAFGLAIFTILYNIAEGLVSTWFGYQDESLALFGFGADSFIEVLSGLGIAHMIIRTRRNPNSPKDPFEQTALRITGLAFYILTAGLTMTGLYYIYTQHRPEATYWGIVISLLSIAVMWALIYGKTTVGKKLKSEAMLADAACTKVCIYMSVILLLSSGIYELTGFAYIDSMGSLGLAWFSFSEGRECFEKARSDKYCSCD
jgi:divalent metal cation (Fe/Co/Zn/Cd) transporter